MHKVYILTSGLLLGLTGTALAQTQAQTQSDALTAPVGVSRTLVRVGTVPPEQRAQDMTSTLQGQLSLDPEETKRVYAVALAYMQGIQADGLRYEREGTQAYQHHAQDAAKRKADYEAGLKAVLTPQQYERHQMIEERFRKLREQSGRP